MPAVSRDVLQYSFRPVEFSAFRSYPSNSLTTMATTQLVKPRAITPTNEFEGQGDEKSGIEKSVEKEDEIRGSQVQESPWNLPASRDHNR